MDEVVVGEEEGGVVAVAVVAEEEGGIGTVTAREGATNKTDRVTVEVAMVSEATEVAGLVTR